MVTLGLSSQVLSLASKKPAYNRSKNLRMTWQFLGRITGQQPGLPANAQVIITSARQVYGEGVTTRSWKPFLKNSCGGVHSWRGRGIAISDSFERYKLIALSGTNFVKNRFIYEYYLGGDPSTYIADTALLPSINLARLMQITAGVQRGLSLHRQVTKSHFVQLTSGCARAKPFSKVALSHISL